MMNYRELFMGSKILLACILFFSFTSLFAQFAGGSGTEINPYQVATPDHLNNVRNYLTSYFIQTADIDLDVAPYNAGAGWETIGFYNGNDDLAIPFTGHYNGNGHVITNLFMNRPSSSWQGLFALSFGASFTNIRLINVNITAQYDVGALVAESSIDSTGAPTSISNCSVDGVVHGYNITGGMVCHNYFSTMTNCCSTAQVMGNNMVGGLIASDDNGTISNCYTTGSVTGNMWVGGLVGQNWESTSLNCYSIGHITATGTYHGGLMGSQDNCTTTNCYWNTQTSGQSTSAGGYGRTTDDMTYPYAANTYVGWDFDTVWGSDVNSNVNNGYPYLQQVTVANADQQYPPLPKIDLSNYPNPFNKITNLTFKLPGISYISMNIYNLKGQLVRTLADGDYSAGRNNFVWDGMSDNGYKMPNGIYICKLRGDGFSQSHKMTLMR
jgi:hypothetical protein